MKCPRCQHDNPQGARFCEECAASLGRTCSNCGTALSATAKFCHDCAHSVLVDVHPGLLSRVSNDLARLLCRVGLDEPLASSQLLGLILPSTEIDSDFREEMLSLSELFCELHLERAAICQRAGRNHNFIAAPLLHDAVALRFEKEGSGPDQQ
jgi:Double zinc ribbon